MYRDALTLIGLAFLVSACGGGGGGGGNPPALSGNANLANLMLSAGTLVPAFAAATTDYTVTVRFSEADTTTVTPTAADAGATVRVDGVVVASGTASAPIALIVGISDIEVAVTAANGTVKTYRVAVVREPAASDADLTDLVVSVTALDQAFQSGQFSYTADAGFLGSTTQVGAVSADPLALIDLNGTVIESGELSPRLELDEGGVTAIELRVTAEDGITQQTYDVALSRASLATLAQRVYAKASNTDEDDVFGAALAVSGDTLVVGAPGEASLSGSQNDNSGVNVGSVYVFVRSSGVWTQQAYLKASNPDSGDRFGAEVAISGNTIAVGAPGEASLDGSEVDNGGVDVGAVYVFVRSGSAWTQEGYLKATHADDNDRFAKVALQDDRLVVGAPGEGSNATGIDGDPTDDSAPGSGAAYAFERSGTAWAQTAYIKASNTDADDQFGWVALSGNTLVVGATGENSGAIGVDGDQADDSQVDAGAVYVFVQDGTDPWSQQAYVKASNASAGDGFGRPAIDGDLLVVGAPGENSAATGIDGNQTDDSAVDAGVAYLFTRSGTTWAQSAYVKAFNTDAGDAFGGAVSVWGDVVAIGAAGEQSGASGVNGNALDNSLPAAGAAYTFENTAVGWLQRLYVKASNTDSNDAFGASVVIDRDLLVSGAVGEGSNAPGIDGDQDDDSVPNAGAAYVFD